MMALKPGNLFAGRYDIVRVVSSGGMGVVYEVLHRETKRRRALKVMLPHVVTDPEMRQRFALEAVVTADIESEHLVEVFDAGIDAETDCPYLVMELLRGEDLGTRLRRGERCSPPELVTLFEQAALALDKTHAAGVVHRDLKPENLFLTRRDDGSPRLKILDFGIAKIVRTTTANPKTTTKTFGTPFFMAREQVTGEAQLIGPSSDTYALAQIAFALLVGVPYFEDEASGAAGNMLVLLLAVGKGPKEPASVRAARRGVTLPAGFDAWFERATKPNPHARFASAREQVAELARILRDLPPEPLSSTAASQGTAASQASGPPLAIGGTVPLSFVAGPAPVAQLREALGPASSDAPSAAAAATPARPESQTGNGSTFSTTEARRPERRSTRGLAAVGALAAGGLAIGAIALVMRETDRAGGEPTAVPTSEGASGAPGATTVEPTVEPGAAASASPAASSASGLASASAPVAASASAAPPVRATGTVPVRTSPPGPVPSAEPVWKTR
jgi:serine/threonine protein kinase